MTEDQLKEMVISIADVLKELRSRGDIPDHEIKRLKSEYQAYSDSDAGRLHSMESRLRQAEYDGRKMSDEFMRETFRLRANK